jgi:hypothetical protein
LERASYVPILHRVRRDALGATEGRLDDHALLP